MVQVLNESVLNGGVKNESVLYECIVFHMSQCINPAQCRSTRLFFSKFIQVIHLEPAPLRLYSLKVYCCMIKCFQIYYVPPTL
jgi:hypothetical protein